jgi:serine/threonine protein kinase/WD40 repeat protein/Tfp pilus assembly protein PilF
MSERDIFIAALQIEDPAQRQAYLDEVCAGDVGLRKQVDDLLRLYEGAGSFLQRPAAESPATGAFPGAAEASSSSERSGASIGPYKLLQTIGEGGMGVVWMAEQTEPVQRKVALKIVKAGMDTRHVIARFEAERQALALMDHPNITKVLDAGATAAGLPFFVMELVKGVPITRYCDEHRLTLRQRLELFLPVCQAIQHAHQKGIIHRDIKPSNVLVAPYDGKPVVKVIDFGIAKAMGQRLTEKTLFTAFGAVMGTLEYMSPEQAELNNQDIDTRSDVYSLGVLLYELLTGTTPCDRERLETAGYDEIRRMIREDEPVTPSTRISTLGAAAALISANRNSDPRRLRQLVRGDLDWIVMKALEKDRNRRYETASTLAADVQRYLHDEPVLACPPSTLYRLRRFVRRYKGLVLAVSLVVLALVGGIIGTSLAAAWLKEERDAALAAERRMTVAQNERLQELYRAHLNGSHSSRLTGRIGQRLDGLRAIRNVLDAVPRDQLSEGQVCELRDELAACLALPDLRLVEQWPVPISSISQGSHVAVDVDDRTDLYVVADVSGPTVIRRFGDASFRVALPGPTQPVEGVCPRFGPGERWLSVYFMGGPDGARLTVWDLAERRLVLELKGAFHDWAFSPDGRRLAAASGPESTIILCDLAGGAEVRRLPRRFRPWQLAFHPDGRRLAVASKDLPAEIIDVETGAVSSLPLAGGTASVAFDPDGRLLALGGRDGRIHLWDVERRGFRPVLTGHPAEVEVLTFSRDGRQLGSCSFDGTGRLWDVARGEQLLSFTGRRLKFFAEDRRLAVMGGADWRVYERVEQGELTTLAHPAAQVEFSPAPQAAADSRWLATAGPAGVHLWDADTLAPAADLQLDLCGTATFRPQGEMLVTYGRLSQLRLWPLRPASEGVAAPWQVGPPRVAPIASPQHRMQHACWTRDGKRLGVVDYRSDKVYLIDPDDPEKPRLLGQLFALGWLALSPHGEWAAAGAFDWRKAVVWRVADGRTVRELTNAGSVAFSGDGRWLGVGSPSSYRLFRTDAWEQSLEVARDEIDYQFAPLAFSPDSRLLAVAVSRRQVRLIETETGRPVLTLTSPDAGIVCSLAFSADGSRLAAARQDRDVQLWDLRAMRRQLAAFDLDRPTPLFKGTPRPRTRGVPLSVALGPSPKTAQNWSDHWKGAAEAEGNWGRFPDAIDAYNRALAALPEGARRERADLMHRRARDQLRNGAPEAARDDWRQALELAPDHAEATHALARLYGAGPPDVRDPRRALPLALTAADRQTPLDWAQNTLGITYYRLGRAKEAVAALERGRERPVKEREPFDLYYLALCYQSLGDAPTAKDFFTRAEAASAPPSPKLTPELAAELRRLRAEAAEVVRPTRKGN